jgi:ferredoxin
MKATVTEECIGCELCCQVCPEVFEMGDEYAEVKTDPVPSEQEDAVRQAAEECPTEAIVVEE